MNSKILLLAMLIIISASTSQVYGHGLGKEDVGPKNIGDRLVSMQISLEPEFKKADQLEDIKLHIQFYEHIDNTKKAIPGIAANIEISRFRDNTLLLNETFHIMSDVEDLEILFHNIESESINIIGMKMGSFGYMRETGNEMVIVEGPIFTTAGLYRFKVTPIALDSESLPKEQRIPFEALVTLAEIKDVMLTHNGRDYMIETIAYYDSLRDLEFDPVNLIMKAEMPFDWALVDDIEMLHFEYYLPHGFELADRELKGYINGMEQSIFVDRSSKDWGAIVHFMIGQKRLKELASMMEGEDLNRAILEIRGGDLIREITLPKEWSQILSVKSDKGNIIVDVQWSPLEINDREDTYFNLTFRDASNNVLEDVMYDIMLVDEEGNVVEGSHRESQMSNIQIYRFTKGGSYTLVLENINGSDEMVMINLRVIPEFPIALMIIAIAMAGVIAIRNNLKLRYL